MAASGRCRLLDKLSAKQLLDSVDTILTDCDGTDSVVRILTVMNVKKYQPVWAVLASSQEWFVRGCVLSVFSNFSHGITLT